MYCSISEIEVQPQLQLTPACQANYCSISEIEVQPQRIDPHIAAGVNCSISEIEVQPQLVEQWYRFLLDCSISEIEVQPQRVGSDRLISIIVAFQKSRSSRNAYLLLAYTVPSLRNSVTVFSRACLSWQSCPYLDCQQSS